MRAISRISVVLLLIGGCSADVDIASIRDASSCAKASGEWQRDCRKQSYSCVTLYKDAGKSCTDSSQCEGGCAIELVMKCDSAGNCVEPEVPEPGAPVTGVCKRVPRTCGSVVYVKDGRAQSVTLHD